MNDRTLEIFGAPIATYTRAQAIEDGVLVDVSDATDAAGKKLSPFKYPVALTRAAYEATIAAGGEWRPIAQPTAEDLALGMVEDLHLPAGQDTDGRLWDVFWLLHCAINQTAGGDTVAFQVRVFDGRRHNVVHLWSKCGPGDTAAPVITIMLRGED